MILNPYSVVATQKQMFTSLLCTLVVQLLCNFDNLTSSPAAHPAEEEDSVFLFF